MADHGVAVLLSHAPLERMARASGVVAADSASSLVRAVLLSGSLSAAVWQEVT